MNNEVKGWIWDQLGASVRSHIDKGGNNPFKIIKITVTVPPAIFKADVLSARGVKYWDETLVIEEDRSCWTTKCNGGCLPYVLLCQLINGGKSFYCKDPVTLRKLDIYIPHIQYMKKSGYLHLEMSLMHKNYKSKIWQVSGHSIR